MPSGEDDIVCVSAGLITAHSLPAPGGEPPRLVPDCSAIFGLCFYSSCIPPRTAQLRKSVQEIFLKFFPAPPARLLALAEEAIASAKHSAVTQSISKRPRASPFRAGASILNNLPVFKDGVLDDIIQVKQMTNTRSVQHYRGHDLRLLLPESFGTTGAGTYLLMAAVGCPQFSFSRDRARGIRNGEKDAGGRVPAVASGAETSENSPEPPLFLGGLDKNPKPRAGPHVRASTFCIEGNCSPRPSLRWRTTRCTSEGSSA